MPRSSQRGPRPPTSGTAGSPARRPGWSPASAGAARPRRGLRRSEAEPPSAVARLGDVLAQLRPEATAARRRVRAQLQGRGVRGGSRLASPDGSTMVSMISIAETISLVVLRDLQPQLGTRHAGQDDAAQVDPRLLVGALQVLDLADVPGSRRRASRSSSKAARSARPRPPGRRSRPPTPPTRSRPAPRRDRAPDVCLETVRRSPVRPCASCPAGRSCDLTRPGHARCSWVLAKCSVFRRSTRDRQCPAPTEAARRPGRSWLG